MALTNNFLPKREEECGSELVAWGHHMDHVEHNFHMAFLSKLKSSTRIPNEITHIVTKGDFVSPTIMFCQ